MTLVKNITYAIALSTAMIGSALACTGSSVTTQSGDILFGRTLEFEVDLKSNVVVVPRNFAFTAQGVDGQPGLSWKSKYAAVGANGFNHNIIVDGLNEKGLAVGSFYFPNAAGYNDVTAKDSQNSVSSYEFGL